MVVDLQKNVECNSIKGDANTKGDAYKSSFFLPYTKGEGDQIGPHAHTFGEGKELDL